METGVLRGSNGGGLEGRNGGVEAALALELAFVVGRFAMYNAIHLALQSIRRLHRVLARKAVVRRLQKTSSHDHSYM